jgi:hypothetical protein
VSLRLLAFGAALPLLCPAFALAQTPNVTNGRVIQQAAPGGVAAAVKTIAGAQTEPVWIGYTAAARPGEHSMCCGENGYWGSCGLEPRNGTTIVDGSRSVTPGTAKLEGEQAVMILLRVQDKTVQKVRMFSPDCQLDAGGRAIYWLGDVNGADSIAFLSSFMSDASPAGTRNDRLSNSALAAIAMHGDPSALPALLTFARKDPSTKVRGEALFWLAQRAGEKAAGEITAAIEQDPDTDVKRRAVFALSQLPKDEGVPLLIQTARTNKNPAVRKQAMFWLGQSKDPRALAFFEEILR